MPIPDNPQAGLRYGINGDSTDILWMSEDGAGPNSVVALITDGALTGLGGFTAMRVIKELVFFGVRTKYPEAAATQALPPGLFTFKDPANTDISRILPLDVIGKNATNLLALWQGEAV